MGYHGPMAEILSEFPPRVLLSAHPFNEWADGRVRSLAAGVDYQGSTRGMIKQLRRAAAARAMSVRTHKTEAGLTIQFVPKLQ